MIPYRDQFGNKITQRDATLATQTTIRTNNPYADSLQKEMHLSYRKAARLATLIADAGVTSDESKLKRVVLIKNEDKAVKAVLKRLEEGKDES